MAFSFPVVERKRGRFGWHFGPVALEAPLAQNKPDSKAVNFGGGGGSVLSHLKPSHMQISYSTLLLSLLRKTNMSQRHASISYFFRMKKRKREC